MIWSGAACDSRWRVHIFHWSSLCGGNVRQDGRKTIPWPITFSKCFTHQHPSYEGYRSTIMRSLLQSAFGFYSWSKEHSRVAALYSPEQHESPRITLLKTKLGILSLSAYSPFFSYSLNGLSLKFCLGFGLSLTNISLLPT